MVMCDDELSFQYISDVFCRKKIVDELLSVDMIMMIMMTR